MKIAVSSYSYSQYIRAGKMTQLDVVAKAHEMGFSAIDFTDLMPNQTPTYEEQIAYAKEIRRQLDARGMEVSAYTIGANLFKGSEEKDRAEVERLCRQLEVAGELGTKVMRHDICSTELLGGKPVGFDRMLETVAKNARAVTDYAEKLGIRTCSENHGYIVQDVDRLERMRAAVGSDNYGFLLDVGNFLFGDVSPVRAFSRLAPFAFHVHAKDFRWYPFDAVLPKEEKVFRSRGCNQLVACAIGEGSVPVAQCFSILKKAGYDGYFTIEYEGREDCIEGIRKGKENLEKILQSI